MKILVLLLFPMSTFCQIPSPDYPVYNGTDLGVHYSKEQTSFKVWAPAADMVKLRLFSKADAVMEDALLALTKNTDGTWSTAVSGDFKNAYYSFEVQQKGGVSQEGPDMYAKAVGMNGKRGMIVDLPSTDPAGWAKDKKPALKNPTDIVIYEAHVRDISINKNSGIQHKGKFLGLTETGTKSPAGERTGIDHLKELGITHIHLLPAFDFNSVDESKPGATYNWGYDPVNYNVPEGSYATDAADGNVRIKEFKQMVQTLHANGIRVILDVVYNHTASLESAFNRFAPGYFYRMKADGSYANGTGCGNETASEKAMMRKFMIESVAYWATEYHLDGFRFDLMGVHDIETMNAISDSLHKIDPTIFIYGEGWAAGASPYPEKLRAVKANTYQLHRIAAFSDDIRDALHGPYSNVKQKGFVSGATGNAESVKFGIVGSVQHPQVDYSKVNYSKKPWAGEPSQSINYVSCHDDNTLWDRLVIDNPTASEADLIKMDLLAQAVVFTSQGVPFLHSGEEMLRSKKGVANSYNSPDSINEIDWARKTKYKAVFNYYKGLIAFRKNHPAFRMPTAAMIREHLRFIETHDPLLVAYTIKGHANGERWKDVLVYINGNAASKTLKLPRGEWTLAMDGNSLSEKGSRKITGAITIAGISEYVLYK